MAKLIQKLRFLKRKLRIELSDDQGRVHELCIDTQKATLMNVHMERPSIELSYAAKAYVERIPGPHMTIRLELRLDNGYFPTWYRVD